MDFNKFMGWLFTILIAIVTFFLLAFYNKVDRLDLHLQQMSLNDAIKNERLKGIEERIIQLEKLTKK
jgi:hypothetical protein